GQRGSWDYRVVTAMPYRHAGQKFIYTDYATPSGKNNRLQYSLYVKYQFRDRESQDSPYSQGTWLGKKNVLNVGAGVLYQADASANLVNADTLYHDARLFSVDLF